MTGLKRLYVNSDETILHYNDETLRDGLLLEEVTYENEGSLVEAINAKLITDSDAHHYTLYEGEFLAPIERLRIIRDIMSIYRKTPKNKLEETLHGLSMASMTASYQSKPGGTEEVKNWIKESFKLVKNEQ